MENLQMNDKPDIDHADISRRLALAIGWDQRDMKSSPAGMVLECRGEYGWQLFSYDDPAVIWPIAERFDAFPYRISGTDRWFARVDGSRYGEYGDTAALAVAMAVIKAKEQP